MNSNFGYNTVELSVIGMNCEHCKKSVEEALSKISGISGISVDLKNDGVFFQLAEESDKEVLIEAAKTAITDIGFDVD